MGQGVTLLRDLKYLDVFDWVGVTLMTIMSLLMVAALVTAVLAGAHWVYVIMVVFALIMIAGATVTMLVCCIGINKINASRGATKGTV